jgi:hypothetical protein
MPPSGRTCELKVRDIRACDQKDEDDDDHDGQERAAVLPADRRIPGRGRSQRELGAEILLEVL